MTPPPKCAILVNAREFILDAFTNPDVYLYLPADDDFKLTTVDNAVRLCRWMSRPDEVREAPDDVFRSTKGVISNALLRKWPDGPYCPLPQSVAFGSLKVMNDWLHTLHRDPIGDIVNFETYYTK